MTSISENTKLFWSYHEAVLHHRSGVESVITYNEQKQLRPQEKKRTSSIATFAPCLPHLTQYLVCLPVLKHLIWKFLI